MAVLRIFNCSDYIHAGGAARSKNSFTKEPTYYGGVREMPSGAFAAAYLPTGGISFMLNPIIEWLVSETKDDETLVFCVDDTPTIKRQMYKDVLKDEMGYKATRAPKQLSISTQRSMIKDVLSLITPNVLFCEGYEADDIIASLVWKYKKSYEHIYIHTRDSDLYSLVDENVSIELVGTQGKIVTRDNFSNVLSGHDERPLPYNTVNLEKLFYGDRSDNIPGIGEDMARTIRNFIRPERYELLLNPNLMRTWVGQACDRHPIVMGVLDLIIPLDIDEDELELYDEPINEGRLFFLANRVGNKYVKKDNWSKDEYPEITDMLNCYTDDFYMKGGRCNG